MRRLPLLLTLLAAGTAAFGDYATELQAFNKAFRSEFPQNRIDAVRALRDADHAEGARMLIGRFLGEQDPQVRDALAGAIADLASEKARRAVKETVLREREEGRRVKLCGLFANGRNLERHELLKALLADPAEKVRVAACGVIGPADVPLVPKLAEAGRLGSPEARAAAMTALGRVNSLDAATPLIEALERERDPRAKAAIVAALVRMSDRNWGDDAAEWRLWLVHQQAKDLPPVDRAILLGAAYLKPRLASLLEIPGAPHIAIEGNHSDARSLVALLVYALHHAGVPKEDPVMVAGVAYMKSRALDFNYTVCLQALALADMDPKAHAARLFEIAQWLADQQCVNGQWSYGWLGADTITPGAEVNTGPRFRVALRDLERQPEGDGSNTQFAILALRATLEAGVEIPAPVWEKALSWYVKHECEDDGQVRARRRRGEEVEQTGKAGGWPYISEPGDPARGSMTCSGLCAVTICLRALGKDAAFKAGKPDSVPMIGRGLHWLGRHWDYARSRGEQGWGLYYDLYSLERVGMILGLEKIDGHDWYAEGVDILLPKQDRAGAWEKNPIDTALAILFLRRATRGYPSDPDDR